MSIDDDHRPSRRRVSTSAPTHGHPDSRDGSLRSYLDCRDSLQRALQQCQCAVTTRFLRMINDRVDERIHELKAQATLTGMASTPLRPDSRPGNPDASSSVRA